MKLNETKLDGVFIIDNFQSKDDRGSFVKTFHEKFFRDNNLCTSFKESYFSISHKDVIRGMHFQLPPYDHEKLVYIANGAVEDVILDLREESSTFGQSIKIHLSAENNRSIYIPRGLAHGFKSLEDNSIMIYNVSTVYHNEFDSGIHYDSFGMDWEIENPKLSDRDKALIPFEQFKKINPFKV